MPNPAKGARLYLKGRGKSALWIIRDGAARIATGCRAGNRQEAEVRLAGYITEKASRHQPPRSRRDPAHIPVADIIGIYLTDITERRHDAAGRKRSAARAERLLTYFGNRMLSDINGTACRGYVDHRRSDGGARRDLQDLSAAIQHHHREGLHVEHVRVWLPPRGGRRERILTRSQIARLVWAAWSYRSPMPTASPLSYAPAERDSAVNADEQGWSCYRAARTVKTFDVTEISRDSGPSRFSRHVVWTRYSPAVIRQVREFSHQSSVSRSGRSAPGR